MHRYKKVAPPELFSVLSVRYDYIENGRVEKWQWTAGEVQAKLVLVRQKSCQKYFEHCIIDTRIVLLFCLIGHELYTLEILHNIVIKNKTPLFSWKKKHVLKRRVYSL